MDDNHDETVDGEIGRKLNLEEDCHRDRKVEEKKKTLEVEHGGVGASQIVRQTRIAEAEDSV
jgi:hypothetical protein